MHEMTHLCKAREGIDQVVINAQAQNDVEGAIKFRGLVDGDALINFNF